MGNYDKVMWRGGEESTPEEWGVGKPKLRSPQEILSKFNKERSEIIERVLKQIGKELEAKFKGESVNIWIDESPEKIDLIIDSLHAEMQQAGWIITERENLHSQKDGNAVRFKVAVSHQS